MKRKTKIIIGIVDIILVFISTVIGLWLLNNEIYSFMFRFLLGFFCMFATTFTILTVINLLKKDS